MINRSDYSGCLEYIKKYWDKIIFYIPDDDGIHIGLLNKFVSPNNQVFRNDQFYWDTYFTILGLNCSGREKLAQDMVDNLINEYQRFGIIPSRNRMYNLGISQIPFLTSMILEVFEKNNDINWLKKTAAVAESELDVVWMDGKQRRKLDNAALIDYERIPFGVLLQNIRAPRVPVLSQVMSEFFPFTKKSFFKENKGNFREVPRERIEVKAGRRLVYKGLSRYCDHHITHLTAEHESGWDMTSRFNSKCLDYLPIDLNCCLYKYESDLARINNILGNAKKERLFKSKAARRKRVINELMWDGKKGFFFDYDFVHNRRSSFYSLAGFYPLWAGLASKRQAGFLRGKLKLFECRGGLANTQKNRLSAEFKQWDYPNAWPNQHWIVVKGLLDYGFMEDAVRIAKKWLDLNKKVFLETGRFWEKYDVVHLAKGKSGSYETQEGFAWTNAVFVRLIAEFSKLE